MSTSWGSLQKRFYFDLAGATGVEPVSTVLETAALPLNYAPKCFFMIA